MRGRHRRHPHHGMNYRNALGNASKLARTMDGGDHARRARHPPLISIFLVDTTTGTEIPYMMVKK